MNNVFCQFVFVFCLILHLKKPLNFFCTNLSFVKHWFSIFIYVFKNLILLQMSSIANEFIEVFLIFLLALSKNLGFRSQLFLFVSAL